MTTLRQMGRKPSLSATNFHVLLRKQLWIWPLSAALILSGLAWWLRSSVEASLKEQVADNLQAVLNADLAALEVWFESQESNVRSLAENPQVQTLVARLVERSGPIEDEQSLRAAIDEPLSELRRNLDGFVKAHGYQGFAIADMDRRIIASSHDVLIGKSHIGDNLAAFESAYNGRAAVSRPFPSIILMPDIDGQLRTGLPTMFAVAPIKGPDGKSIAVLGLRIRPDLDFTRILSLARLGKTGETYVVNADGLLLSESRFDDQLKAIGLLTDQPTARSVLTLEARDPEVDMTRGNRPQVRRGNQALTHAVAQAAAGHDGVDVTGYRDYRGVLSIGAWRWLPDRNFAVITELDMVEALRPLHLVRMAFWGLLGLLLLSSVAIFMFSVIVARLQRSARNAALEVKRLGQYVLDNKIGAGGMGAVYRAHHAMLRRPTAIKLIDPDKTTSTTIARFEREVQMTSQLNHPNTIAIYDFGRTPEGLFYYAMELLEGITLQALVEKFGAQVEGRVIYILRQLCGSLAEAHGIGLVHRDIKPANIMLNRRGGMSDVVKLLDFGLVKAIDNQQQATMTMSQGMMGTPLYLSPEGVDQPNLVDARSDLYAVGAVGYFLLTGTPVFEGQTVIDICMKHVSAVPEPPSRRLGRAISSDLESLLLDCLAKEPDGRPASATVLEQRLAACGEAHSWTAANAAAWWDSFQMPTGFSSEVPTETDNHEQTIDYSHRAPGATRSSPPAARDGKI